MWSDFSGKAFTREQYAAHVATLRWKTWKPIGITLHNTAAPTLAPISPGCSSPSVIANASLGS